MKNAWILALTLLLPTHVVANELLGLPATPIPIDNPQNANKIELGKKIFHDRRFSADGTISCATCHQPEKAFTDGLSRARGLDHIEGPRNTPTLINSAYYHGLFLDGRRDSLENQALDPIFNPIEHGLRNPSALLTIINDDNHYQKLFAQSFGIQPQSITETHLAKALASYERTLVTGNSAFDRYFFKSQRQALSASEARGLRIFRRKANCTNCHEISWDHALFTDNRYYNIGVGFKRISAKLGAYIQSLSVEKLQSSPLTDLEKSELGRFNVTRVLQDIGKFKTPSLRNIALTAPYMHDGSFKTLEEVIDYYNKGGEKNPYLDPAIFPLNLSELEKADLSAFLKTITSPHTSDISSQK